jgi:hypothetical protein
MLGFFGFHHEQVVLYHLCHFLLIALKNMRMFIVRTHYIHESLIKDCLKFPSWTSIIWYKEYLFISCVGRLYVLYICSSNVSSLSRSSITPVSAATLSSSCVITRNSSPFSSAPVPAPAIVSSSLAFNKTPSWGRFVYFHRQYID